MPNKKVTVYRLIESDFRTNYRKRVSGLMKRGHSQHDAEDAVQEAYARACQYWSAFEGERDFHNWLSGIVSNAASDQRRAEQRHGMAEPIEEVELPVPDGLDSDLMRAEITKMIQKKTGATQTILRYWFNKGYTPKEIDQVLEISYKRIRNVITDFRNELKLVYA